jgi:hypothetical protein
MNTPSAGSIDVYYEQPSPFSAWRLAAFLVPCAGAAAFVAFLTMAAPVQIPALEGDHARYWPAAAVAAGAVLAVCAVIVMATRRRRTPPRRTDWSGHDPLSFEVLPAAAVCLCVAASALIAAGGVILGVPAWAVVLAALTPWLPVLAIEGIAKYRRYGVYILFVAVALLQTGHLGEHTAQVTQLLMTSGDLDRSRGIFGQLDFETIHFFWDTVIWLTTCAVVFKFSRNTWLWTAFAFASLHEIEHIYLYWLYLAHNEFYMNGGLAGIMGHGGVVGSPLPRPYLHFMYNFLITVPMLIGLRQQAYPPNPAPANISLSAARTHPLSEPLH